MKKSKEDIVKYHKMKRKKHKIKLAIITILLSIISLFLIGTYFYLNKQDFINYIETSNVKYEVYLKENEFYEENYLEEGMDIISTLIERIIAEFRYDLELSEELEYKYDYKILAEVEVKEKSKSNLIYKIEDEILNKTVEEIKNNKLEIVETIDIDYNKYNDQIKRLIEVYELKNTDSDLNVTLYLNVINKNNGDNINKENKVALITIPLATNTVEITKHENVKDNKDVILITGIQYKNLEYIFILGLLMLIIGIITLIRLIKYISDTKSAERMYDDQLKKILFDYKSYIQKINNMLDYKDYKVVSVGTFKELLGMREELQSPILMYTEENTRRTTFLMVNQNLLFEYILDSKLIREELIKKNKEKKEKENEKNK